MQTMKNFVIFKRTYKKYNWFGEEKKLLPLRKEELKSYQDAKVCYIYTFKLSNNDINKFLLLLRKGVYPYEYMDDWEKFNETTLPEKEEFYSNLNME